ncbi:MAG: MATE family efflux transporter, partial [Oscillospiraceae bacterium]|nr:MATE family efflux transporter [Oscillospiraceae bacterium]
AKLYAGQIILIHAGVVFGQSMCCISLLGILRGGGDTRFVLLADLIFMWIICIPMGFIAGLWLGWPVPLVYAIIKCDEWLKSAAAFIRIARGKWINDITLRTDASPR